ncbi:MAG: hypothetical protein QF415_00145 [Candidatus Undinarchaeales archaeon]|nr:hypothetical protein [Candidatus Undinarchaeales archaeon]MDP7492185.1 hypothetical protein [Candidatus Undinarchaeales archaeon]
MHELAVPLKIALELVGRLHQILIDSRRLVQSGDHPRDGHWIGRGQGESELCRLQELLAVSGDEPSGEEVGHGGGTGGTNNNIGMPSSVLSPEHACDVLDGPDPLVTAEVGDVATVVLRKEP